MKLIEKLANESGWEFKRPIPPGANATMPFDHVWRVAFEAGFRKARELAYELMRSNSDKRVFCLDVDIENLGEEEV